MLKDMSGKISQAKDGKRNPYTGIKFFL